MLNYKSIPKVRDSLSFLYVEHAIIEKDQKAIKLIEKDGIIPVPVAALTLLMLGPGTTITHDAVKIITENGCTIIWTGEEGVRTYASSTGETRKSIRILKQAKYWGDDEKRLRVVLKMYYKRFKEHMSEKLTLQQLRGHEGVRVRETYAYYSDLYKIQWEGRSYDRNNWNNSEPINRALSTANACLYGIAHAAIISVGYSPALGFIHTGKQLSFVYDIADLYKTEITIPVAFQVVSEEPEHLERTIRQRLRDIFKEKKFLSLIVPDIDSLFEIDEQTESEYDEDPAKPSELWEPSKEIEHKVLW